MSRPTPRAATAQVSPEELAAAFEGPAYFTNKFYLTVTGTMARISFTEQLPAPDGSIRYRTAISMTVDDLLKLRDLIQQFTSQVQIISVQTSQPPAAPPATTPPVGSNA